MIYHITTESELRAGVSDASYIPRTFTADGFVHCAASPASVLAVAQDYFADATEPVVLLQIDPSRLTSKLVFEAAAPIAGGGTTHLTPGESFPHIYGPVNLSAVTGAAWLERDGRLFRWPQRIGVLDALLGERP